MGGTVQQLRGMLGDLDAAVGSLHAAGTVIGPVGERLDRLVADVADAVQAGDDAMLGYVVGSLAGQACGMAMVADRDGDRADAERWRDVARGARTVAAALLRPAAR